jgi:hypothetical protein
MENAQIIELLKDDKNYYGEFGHKFLSNSDIGTLIHNPRMFGKKSEPSLAMLQGSYFHTACLEPLKLKDFILIDASTRTTNIYKDACKEYNSNFLLLKKEAEEVDEMVNALRGNKELSKLVWDNGVKYEVPILGDIQGLMWKGKCDIINGDNIYDLKTTTSLDDFKYSAKKYNYDSQVAIYEYLTKKKMSFIVIEKGTNRLGYFQVSDEFRESGWTKVGKALENYNKFYGSNPTEDVNQYFLNSYLF